MAQVISISSIGNGSRTNTTITAPSSIVNGNLLLAIIVVGDSGDTTGPTITPPSGFNAATGYPKNWGYDADSTYGLTFGIYIKIASSESGSYTFTHSTASSEAVLYNISYIDATTPLNPNVSASRGGDYLGSAGAPADGQTTTWTGLTTPNDNSLVIAAEGCWDDAGGTTPPTGSTPTFANRYAPGTGILYVCDGVLAAAGATGNKTHTNGNNDDNSPWEAALICVQNGVSGVAQTGDLIGTLIANGGSQVNPSPINGNVTVSVGDLVYAVWTQQTNLTVGTGPANPQDNLGNTYAWCNAGTDPGTPTARAGWSVVTTAGTLTQITAAASASTNNYANAAAVIKGPFEANANQPDANPANGSDNTSPFACPSTGTLAQADEVIMCFWAGATSATQAASSPNLLAVQEVNSTTNRIIIGYQKVSSTNAVAPEFTGTASGNQAITGTTSFKLTPSGSTGTGTLASAAATAAGSGISASYGEGTPSGLGSTIIGAGVSGSIGSAVLVVSDSILVGSGVVNDGAITGTGVLTSDAAVSAGTGISMSTGTGAATSTSATALGVGASASAGIGALTMQDSQASGAGADASVGSGDVSAQAAIVAGAGLVEWTGTGVLVSGDAAAAGTGISTSYGEGALTGLGSTVVGAGVSESTGSALLVVSDSTSAGAGVIGDGTITGAGTLASTAAVIVGAGVSASTGTGAAVSAAVTVSGIGVSASTATGALVMQESQASGAGIDASVGSGAVSAQASTVTGDGTDASVGSGAVSAQASTVTGDGIDASIGSGAIAMQTANVTGSGDMIPAISGSGDLNLSGISAAGTGVSGSIGTGTLLTQSALATSSGVSFSTGAGVLAQQAHAVSGIGVSLSQGNGILLAQAATVTGSGVSWSIGTGMIQAGESLVFGTEEETTGGAIDETVPFDLIIPGWPGDTGVNHASP